MSAPAARPGPGATTPKAPSARSRRRHPKPHPEPHFKRHPNPERPASPSGGLAVVNVSLRLLRAFVAVVNQGNVGRAAARLYVSQPSLSQDIRRLARTVGADLGGDPTECG
jgi:Bacterial regulatory helix-turn-helix protein, lysR family